MPDEVFKLIPDQPPINPSQDEYDRVPFAAKLVEALEHLPDSSFVVGLEGVWGCGKTAILNFIVNLIEQKPPEQQPIVVRFNPWWFTGREDLTQRFFDTLASAVNPIGETESRDREKVAGILQSIGRYGLPAARAVFGKDRVEGFADFFKLFVDYSQALQEQKPQNLDQLKKTAGYELEKLKIPIWVILDDVDRLLPQEALEVLTMVRGVGDLPMVRYLLAYDRIQLEARLATAIGGSEDDARDYINKIIQLSFPIPNPANWRLKEKVVAGVTQVLGGPQISFLIDDFLTLTVGTLIRTPRDVKRLINAFGIARSMVGQELNAPDLLRLELLRLEFPRVYEKLPLLKNRLLGRLQLNDFDAQGGLEAATEEYIREQLKPLALGSSGEYVLPLVQQLFPRMGVPISGFAVSSNTQRRIGSTDFFDFYFQRGLDESVLSISEIDNLKSFLDNGNTQALGNYFTVLNDVPVPRSTISRAFLALFWCVDAMKNDNRDQQMLTFVDALLAIGDHLGQTEYFQNNASFHIFAGSVIYEMCLSKYNPEVRSQISKEIFEKLKSGPSLSTALMAAQLVDQEIPNTPWSHGVTDSLLQDMRIALVERFQKEQNCYLKTPTLIWALLDGLSWACQDNDLQAKEFANKLVRESVLTLMLATSFGYKNDPLLKPEPANFGGINVQMLKKYVDIQLLKREAGKLFQNEQGEQFKQKYLWELNERFPMEQG